MVNGTDFGVLQPLIETITNAVGTLKYALGGLFGIYLILLILKVYQTYMLRKELKEMTAEMKKTQLSVKHIEHLTERNVRKN